MLPEITRKSLLYKSGVDGADYCLNHIEGCSHGCNFPCYAMLMKKRSGKIKDYQDWIKPKIVANALKLLDSELPKLKDKIKNIHLCFATDPFMHCQPEIIALTLKIMEKINRENIKCTILTKGILPKELANAKKYGKNNEYGITLISLDENFRKEFEPGTAPYQERINALKYLHDRGFETSICIEPYPPPNFVKQDLDEILERIKFVDEIFFGRLNYNLSADQAPGIDAFYQKCADAMKDFCKKNKIECHTKYGTSKKDDKITDGISGKGSRIKKFGGVLEIPI